MNRLHKHARVMSYVLFILICLLFVFSPSAVVFAELKTDILFTINETRNMAITVSYDTETPIISFIAPNGQKFSDGIPANKMTVEYTEGNIYYLIPNAMPGDWLIEYDKLSNGTINISYAPYAETVSIERLELESINGNRAYINFDVSYIEDTNYDYIVYAVLTGENSSVTGQKELMRGSAITNKTISEEVPLNTLSSFDSYHLMLEVYLKSGGIEVFDTSVIEDSFSFTNSGTSSGIRDFYTEIDLTNQSLLIDWEDYKVYNCQEYIVAVYNSEDLNDPFFSSTYEPNLTSTEILIDTSIDFIRVELSYRKNDVISEVTRKDIFFNTGTMISISTEAETNSAQAIINYESKYSIPVIVTVNGKSETVIISGNGYFSVEIEEFTNELQVAYNPKENICFIVKAYIYSDRTPPLLLLYENISTITTAASSFTLAGETEPGSSLIINNEAAAINEDGTFLHELKLVAGDNAFSIVATDVAGNSTLQTINIIRSGATAFNNKGNFTLKGFLPLIVSFTLSMVLIICIYIFTRLYAKKAPEGRLMAILLVLRNIFAVITVIAFTALIISFILRINASGIINSSEYYHLMQKSVQDAYEAISRYERINTLFIIVCIVFGSSLLMTVLLSWILHLLKKKSAKLIES